LGQAAFRGFAPHKCLRIQHRIIIAVAICVKGLGICGVIVYLAVTIIIASIADLDGTRVDVGCCVNAISTTLWTHCRCSIHYAIAITKPIAIFVAPFVDYPVTIIVEVVTGDFVKLGWAFCHNVTR
jgi:hypothetical protein